MADKVLAENDIAEVASYLGFLNEKLSIVQHDRVMADPRAKFAISLMEKWGLVSALPDGNDEAGRQKHRMADPDEIVKRACDIANIAFVAFEQRGWLLKIGSIETAREKANK